MKWIQIVLVFCVIEQIQASEGPRVATKTPTPSSRSSLKTEPPLQAEQQYFETHQTSSRPPTPTRELPRLPEHVDLVQKITNELNKRPAKQDMETLNDNLKQLSTYDLENLLPEQQKEIRNALLKGYDRYATELYNRISKKQKFDINDAREYLQNALRFDLILYEVFKQKDLSDLSSEEFLKKQKKLNNQRKEILEKIKDLDPSLQNFDIPYYEIEKKLKIMETSNLDLSNARKFIIRTKALDELFYAAQESTPIAQERKYEEIKNFLDNILIKTLQKGFIALPPRFETRSQEIPPPLPPRESYQPTSETPKTSGSFKSPVVSQQAPPAPPPPPKFPQISISPSAQQTGLTQEQQIAQQKAGLQKKETVKQPIAPTPLQAALTSSPIWQAAKQKISEEETKQPSVEEEELSVSEW